VKHPSNDYAHVVLDVSGHTLTKLLPHVEKAIAEEWESERTKIELENLRNDIRAHLQHVGVYI
jgi:hypothetical protein